MARVGSVVALQAVTPDPPVLDTVKVTTGVHFYNSADELVATLALDSAETRVTTKNSGGSEARLWSREGLEQLSSSELEDSSVVAGKIASGGVSASLQVAANILGAYHTVADNVGRVRNVDVNMWSGGTNSPPDFWGVV